MPYHKGELDITKKIVNGDKKHSVLMNEKKSWLDTVLVESKKLDQFSSVGRDIVT